MATKRTLAYILASIFQDSQNAGITASKLRDVASSLLNSDNTVTYVVDAGLTADSGSIQGGTPLTDRINEISTCATTGDSVTLPDAEAGIFITIINNGANSCDVFPALGDNLGSGLNTASGLAAGNTITYASYDATNWVVV